MDRNKVTEEMLRESVARGIPKPMTYTPSPSPKEDDSVEQEQTTQRVEPRKRVAKTQEEKYVCIYLAKTEIKSKQLLYVSKATHRRLANFVQLVGEQSMTLTCYVENILKDHLDKNKSVMEGLMKANIEYDNE